MRIIEPPAETGVATMTIWTAVLDMGQRTAAKAATITKCGLMLASRPALNMKTATSSAGTEIEAVLGTCRVLPSALPIRSRCDLLGILRRNLKLGTSVIQHTPVVRRTIVVRERVQGGAGDRIRWIVCSGSP
ncbi:hypothetical protein ACVWWO_002222 [Bradyrhizobium sp. F1.13.1]